MKLCVLLTEYFLCPCRKIKGDISLLQLNFAFGLSSSMQVKIVPSPVDKQRLEIQHKKKQK